MKQRTLLVLFTFLTFGICTAQPGSKAPARIPITAIDMNRVNEIIPLLPEKPKGFGLPISERTMWDEMHASGKYRHLVSSANKFLAEPYPELTEEIYLSFFNSNNSELSKGLIVKRRNILSTWVLAECLTNQGKYLDAIKHAIKDIIALRSWNFPAEDRQKTNWNGTQYTIELAPAAYAHELALTMYLLGDLIENDLREKLMDALYLRVFDPALQAIDTKNANSEWIPLTSTGNHNAVTLSGITGAALTVIASKEERAKFIAIAERYIQNSFNGFLEDGYCTEGIDYFNYGFNHVVLLRESILQSTDHRLDILSNNEKVGKIALFAPNMEIMNDVYPAIGDCKPYPKPGTALVDYLNTTLGIKNERFQKKEFKLIPPMSNLMYVFPNNVTHAKIIGGGNVTIGLRSFFEHGGVLNVRPRQETSGQLAASIKGGNNAEKHNHNDIGSFSIVKGKELIMGDPGLPVYTSIQFSPQRYTIKTNASYGHPVPLIDDKQQMEGKQAYAHIIAKHFTDAEDVLEMDISSAYDVPALNFLSRKFRYNRQGEGFLEVRDSISFSKPSTYETAFITRGSWKQISDSRIEISKGKEKIVVDINVPKGGFSITEETITESAIPYKRLAVKLNNPLTKGNVTLTFRPH